MMYPKLWYVITYPTTNERHNPIELHYPNAKEGAEHVAKMYQLKDSSIIVKVYTEYPSSSDPERDLLSAYTFSWELRPVAQLAELRAWPK
jgi:hypothetical protein